MLDDKAIDPERAEAIQQLVEALAPDDILRRWARDNPPPQEWFDEDLDDLL